MERRNNFIVAQASILLCALALPFISLYCQEKSPRQGSVSQRRATARRLTPQERTIKRRLELANKKTVEPTSEPTLEKTAEPINKEPLTEKEVPKEAESTITKTSPQQAEIREIAAPHTWTHWYRNIAPFLLGSLYKGSETGISALTKTLIKHFIIRRDNLPTILAKKQELTLQKQKLYSQIAQLSEEEREIYREKEEKWMSDFSKKENELGQLEAQTSLSSIVATSAYMGMLNTAVPMFGILMGSAVKITLQMLMPVDNS